jgi:hypothetical protein
VNTCSGMHSCGCAGHHATHAPIRRMPNLQSRCLTWLLASAVYQSSQSWCICLLSKVRHPMKRIGNLNSQKWATSLRFGPCRQRTFIIPCLSSWSDICRVFRLYNRKASKSMLRLMLVPTASSSRFVVSCTLRRSCLCPRAEIAQ